MGYRLSKIYTRTGDDGTTGLADSSRVGKDQPRINTFGDVDELNSLLGLLVTHSLDEKIKEYLLDIQHMLFDLGGELAMPGSEILDGAYVDYLERLIDEYNSTLKPLKEFILPGGNVASATCHCARAVCRRAERQLVSLSRETTVNPVSLKFLNRLSDWLFVLARVFIYEAGNDEIYWQIKRIRKDN